MNAKVQVRPSSIHGKGMFAKAAINKGEIVAIWGGNFVSKEVAEKVLMSEGKRIQQIDDNVFEVFSYKTRGDDPTYFHNHSCDPNIWMQNEVTVTACRHIEVDEELTIDYAMFETKEDRVIIKNCACGSTNCRATITGNDWRLPELQDRYANHFSPLINRRIAKLNQHFDT